MIPVARNAFDRGSSQLPIGGENILFSSGKRELKAPCVGQRIAVAAREGGNRDGLFQQAINDTLRQAQNEGQENPIVIGAIPFDVREASCLYVPERYEWRDLSDDDGSSETKDGSMPELLEQKSFPDEDGFKREVRHAIVNFQHSDVRKAVLSVIRELHFSGSVDVGCLLNNLRCQNASGYQFQIPLHDGGSLVGISPELLIRKEGQEIVSNPLAGSAKRHANKEADQAAADELLQSAKDHYEHSLVIDDIRKILTPHCSRLQIPVRPSLINTATLWHLSTRIEGRISDPQMNALQLACLLHPTPAVCGFPTEKARRLINFVEPFERGLFTGMVGWCDAKGNGEWVVTIRCGIVKNDRVSLFAGAGIVEASQPDSEWVEVQTKLKTMLNAFGVAA